DTRLYVLIERVRSVAGMTKGTVEIVAGKGIGSVMFESDVYVCGVYVRPSLLDPIRLTPGTLPITVSTVLKFRSAPWDLIPYPDGRTVLPAPTNHGTFHASPTAGAKLFRSLPKRLTDTLGFGEFLPTNCTRVRSLHVLVKFGVPGLDVHVTAVNALSSFPM